jgi:hypothetical protein
MLTRFEAVQLNVLRVGLVESSTYVIDINVYIGQ